MHPSLYGVADDQTPDCHDDQRDATTLPLIRAAVAEHVPLLGICRGLQEINVALGGTLHQAIHELPNRADHRGGEGSSDWRYRPKHKVALSGSLSQLFGHPEIEVNSVHGQAIDRLAPGLVAEAMAPDGTIEAVRHEASLGFTLGVQWHPEWRYQDDANSLSLFRAFGQACRMRAANAHRTA
jgi:putative glutamine amidotransferase